MKEALSHFLEHIRGLGGIRATILSVLTATALYLGGKLFDEFDDSLVAGSGIPRSMILPILFGIVVLLAAAFIAYEWGRARIRKTVPQFHEAFPVGIESIRYRTPQLGRAINEVLIPKLFPSPLNPSGAETMPYEEIEKAGTLNRYTAVGVSADRRVCGYAAFWPVTDEIGQKLLAGEMNDSDLLADHLIPESSRQNAKYAVIPGFGVLHPKKAVRVRAAVALFHTLKTLIAKEYLRGNKRGYIIVIAFPYSNEGREWCEKLEFVRNGNHVTYADGLIVPVASRKVSLIDLV